MSNKYQHLMSPLTVGGKTFKNRMSLSKCGLGYPTVAQAEEFYIRCAKNGAASVCVFMGEYPGREQNIGPVNGHAEIFPALNMLDPEVREDFKRMNDKLHAEDTLSSASMMSIEPTDCLIAELTNWGTFPMEGDYNSSINFQGPGISLERLEKLLDEFIFRAKDFYSLGFDIVTFYMSYRASILANSLSPVMNLRTDKYGGKTNKERAALTVELFSRLKKECPGLLIEVQISGEEEAPGYTTEDWLEYCKLWEGMVDLIQVRGYDGSSTHVNGYNMRPHCPPNLRFAEAFKKAGIDIVIAPVGGFSELDDMEKALAEGKADLIALSRRFISEPELEKKIREGRTEDIAPCLLCNDCHGRHRCAVNPLSLTKDNTYTAPEKSKKVAVIGGGPAGLMAALTAAQRGHKVVVFEKSGALGGQLKIAGVPEFKWPLANYRDWLIRQAEKSGAEIRLNAPATAEQIKAEGFDAVICALGSEPKLPPVKGSDAGFVWNADDVFGHEAELGERVVVIGGATTGRECALYLAQNGHKATMLTRQQAALFRDFHAQHAEEDAFASNPNIGYIDHCSTKEICDGYVICDVKLGIPTVPLGFGGFAIPGHQSFDLPGGRQWPAPEYDESNMTIEERRIEFDSIVVSGGRGANTAEAGLFEGAAPEVYVIGDNIAPGGIRECTETAYDVAMRL